MEGIPDISQFCSSGKIIRNVSIRVFRVLLHAIDKTHDVAIDEAGRHTARDIAIAIMPITVNLIIC